MIPIVNTQYDPQPVVAIVVKPHSCYSDKEHILSYNAYHRAIMCKRCGQPYILGLKEIEPGKWERDSEFLSAMGR